MRALRVIFCTVAGPPEPLPRFVDRTVSTGEYELVFDYEGAMVPERASAGGPTLPEVLEKPGLKLSKVRPVPMEALVIVSDRSR
jgi:hypothetical protein